MKRITLLITVVILILSNISSTFASNVGKVIGTAYHTDIVAYINNYAIPSYAVSGTSVIVVEDLRNFGFDVAWNQSARTLTISRNNQQIPNVMNFEKNYATGTKFANILATDIAVYAGGVKIPSYALNGYTMISLESLTMFGTCNWVAEQRAIKLWVDGLNVRDSMQTIKNTSQNVQNTNVLSVSDAAYNFIKDYIINYGIKIESGGYAYYANSNTKYEVLIVYSPSNDCISLYKTDVDDSKTTCLIMISPNEDYFYYSISRSDDMIGLGRMRRNLLTLDTEYMFYDETKNVPSGIKVLFSKLGATNVKLTLLCTDYFLVGKELPIRIKDLGFSNLSVE